MKIDKLDWYSYLATEFKVARDLYVVNDRAVFECPRCLVTAVVRINHVKEKIKKLGKYECSKCRKRDSIERARAACNKKYGGKNPFAIEEVKKKIRTTTLKRYGVENVLQLPEIHKKGIDTAASQEARAQAKKTLQINHGVNSILDLPNVREKVKAKLKTQVVRDKYNQTMIKKYGVTSNLAREEVHTKIKNTNKEKYGADYPLENKTIWEKGHQKTLIAIRERLTLQKERGTKECKECNKTRPLEQFREHSYTCYSCNNRKNREKYKSDPKVKLKSHVRQLLRRVKLSQVSPENVVGCSLEKYKKHLENQFQPGMTWENWRYTGWHVDHIIPLSCFDLSNENEVRAANYYKNLRPLWAKDNQNRSDSLPSVIILTGCFGSGKSTVASKFNEKFHILDYDLGHTIYDVAKCSRDKIVLYQVSIKAKSTIQEFSKYFNTMTIVILEDPQTVIDRITIRDGNANPETVIRRTIRFIGIANFLADFSGTADECANWLKQIAECHRA